MLLDRLQRALHPQFTIDREIAGGGMGRVFLGHDVALDRPVAIKILRPELATAAAAERFLREARILARLRHPNVVPVFQGGEADGLLYHVLEYQDGQTLAARLEQGPLSEGELRRLADGLLAALEAAHGAGVIHRDIKPSNIFLVADRVVVGDFGIAHTDTTGEPLTETGSLLGTRAYMAPEQLRGAPTGPATDLYAAALVLAEAATGRRIEGPGGGAARWAGVPRGMARVLRRALADAPGARWPSATAMRSALSHPRGRRWLIPTAAAGGALLLWFGWSSTEGAATPERFVVGLARFDPIGIGRDIPWHDSVRIALAERLRGFPDWVVDAQNAGGVSLRVSGTVERRGDSLRADLYAAAPGGASRPIIVPAVPMAGWRPLVERLTREVVLAVWGVRLGDAGTLPCGTLPCGALPQSARGTERWLRAEFAYRDGQWDEARRGYENAEAVDGTCLLCTWRIRDLDRWLNRPSDSLRLRRLLDHLERFPPEYRELIAAGALPLRQRLDTLRVLAARRREFFDLHYILGDELLHRGPLVGIPRREAVEELRTARRLRPDFAGVAEHLAWAFIAEGDGDSARAVLDQLAARHPPVDRFAAGLRAFHELAWHWRFQPATAPAMTARLLAQEAVATSADLAAAPRVLPALGAPDGAVGLGRQLAASRPDLIRAAMVAQWLGNLALGRDSAAAEAARTLLDRADQVDWRVAVLQVGVLRQMLGEAGPAEPSAVEALLRLGRRGDLPASLRHRIAWSVALGSNPAAGLEPPDPPDPLLAARRAAAAGNHAEALRLTDGLAATGYRPQDPIATAATRLLRADWLGAMGRHAEAAAELLWYQHSDLAETPRDLVQPGEIDWAMGTVALWRRAGHLEAEGESGRELCRAYTEVARRWSGGDAPAAARADSARARAAALRCENLQ